MIEIRFAVFSVLGDDGVIGRLVGLGPFQDGFQANLVVQVAAFSVADRPHVGDADDGCFLGGLNELFQESAWV